MWSLMKFFRTATVNKNNRRVALTTIHTHLYVSTVLVSLNRFETMIFGGPRDKESFEYATIEEAKAGHRKLVEELMLTRRLNLIETAGRLAIREKDCEPV